MHVRGLMLLRSQTYDFLLNENVLQLHAPDRAHSGNPLDLLEAVSIIRMVGNRLVPDIPIDHSASKV